MRLRAKKIDAPKVSEPVMLTNTGPFYSDDIDFRDNMRKFKIPGVNSKHLHNSSSNLRIGYIVAEGTHVSPPQQINTVHNRKDWRN